jgi:hypothetical protein
MKKTIFTLAAFMVGVILFMGQKFQDDSPRWNPNPASTRITPLTQYDNLPSYPNTNNYVNPNTVTQYYNTPQGVMAVSPNFRIFPNNAPNTQSEVIITSSLNNPNYMLASANYFNGASSFSTGGYISTNGGLNWGGADVTVSNYGDPGPMVDKDNNYIISFITLAGSMGSTRSTNFGATWSAAYTFPGATTSADKNLSGTNYAASSPYYGHSYTVYTEFGGSYVNRIVFTKTTTGGVSWTTVSVLSPPVASGHHHQGCDITAGPEGNVYAVWANCLTSGQNSTEDSLGFAKSTDGGTTWAITKNNAFDMNGIRAGSFGPWGIRVAGFPRVDVDRSGGARNGWIYTVAAQKNFAGGDAADIFMWRSSNLGVTWSAPIRVNQDAANGKLQYHAAINVDAGGGVNVVYHDCRNSNNNDSVQTFVNRSVDGGNTWTEILVSDAKFRPAPISGTATGYQGDYIGITSGNNRIIPNWADNRIGRYQSWAAIIDIGPSILHTPLSNTEQISGNRVVNASIIPAGSGLNPGLTKLYYAKNNTAFASVPLTNTSGTNWTANLPLTGAGTYNYYLTTTDSLIRTATSPAGAPANYHSFSATSDTTKPIIVTTPLGDVPKSLWPATVTATVTDNIGLDSVWVKWYKNNTGTGIKQFRLLNTSGSVYAAAFNSTQPEVAFNDSIFYRVFARDISSGHNTDSTALYKFKIINLTNICIGTGTTSSNYPFTTYWMDGRTQMLFTAAEIIAAGGTANAVITKLGFNVITADPGLMNGFNVKYQLTAQPSLTGFVTSGTWFTGYTGAYTVPGSGWQYIDMTSPYFQWNGTSNILVEICYDNTAYTQYSTVNATSAAGMTWGYNTDGSSGCTMSGGSAQANRPNVCFTMTTPMGVNPVGNTIPTVYSLSQNYPNPFNPVTKINFAIPKQGLVTLKIYDVLGREVRTLVSEVKTPGNYAVDFNGAELSSGVYFYRLQSADFTDIKRMMLIK